MRHRLRNCLAFWLTICGSSMVLSWVEEGFKLRWLGDTPPPPCAMRNHASALSEHPQFVSAQITELLAAQTIVRWPENSTPTVVSPLGVVVQNGKKRLIFDARYINSLMIVPKFKYEDLGTCGQYLQEGDWLCTVDLSKGFHHLDIHEDSVPFLGFEWEGQYYAYVGMPFGVAVAPWAFTKLTRVLLTRWREKGHRCSGYIDDSMHAAQSKDALAKFMAEQVHPDQRRAVSSPT
jgi:hypothetical protein